MYPCFDASGLSTERLLREWKWLITGEFGLLAVNAFGDLFLKDVQGPVHRLEVEVGRISVIASSEEEFRRSASKTSNQREWFLTDRAEQAERKGYCPGKGQCVGSKIPWVFQQSADLAENLYVADLYEYVSFMGDLHRQISDVPDGGSLRLEIHPGPEQPRKIKD